VLLLLKKKKSVFFFKKSFVFFCLQSFSDLSSIRTPFKSKKCRHLKVEHASAGISSSPPKYCFTFSQNEKPIRTMFSFCFILVKTKTNLHNIPFQNRLLLLYSKMNLLLRTMKEKWKNLQKSFWLGGGGAQFIKFYFYCKNFIFKKKDLFCI